MCELKLNLPQMRDPYLSAFTFNISPISTSTPRYDPSSAAVFSLRSQSLPSLEEGCERAKRLHHKSQSIEIVEQIEPTFEGGRDPLAVISRMLGLNPYRSSFPDVVSRIEQLQERIHGQQTVALRRTYELETLRERVEVAGREVEDLRRENRSADMRNRALDHELLRLRRHGKRRAARRLSLPETSTAATRKVSGHTDTGCSVSPAQSVWSASWDNVGSNKELSTHEVHRRPSYVSDAVSENFDISDFEITLQDAGLEDNRSLKQKIQILERLLKESTSLHAQSGADLHPMSDASRDRVPRPEFELLKSQHDDLTRENERLLSKWEEESQKLEESTITIENLKAEMGILGAELERRREDVRVLEWEKAELKEKLKGGGSRGKLTKQLSVEEQVSGCITSEEKDNMIASLDEKVASLALELEGYKEVLRNGNCDECKGHRERVERLERELSDQMEAQSKKYDGMVDHYDGMLRERAFDIKELEMQLAAVKNDKRDMEKILRNTVGTAKATKEQVNNYRRASRVSTIQGPASLPRDIDKDQLISQLTNELTKANQEKEDMEKDINTLENRLQTKEEELEDSQIEVEEGKQEKEVLMTEIKIRLDDPEFLKNLFVEKSRNDPLFYKTIISEGRSNSVHSLELDEDIELKLKKRAEEYSLLEQEYYEREDQVNQLQRQLAVTTEENKELTSYRDTNAALVQVITEYCSGKRKPPNPELMLYPDDNLNDLVKALYNYQMRVNTLEQASHEMERALAVHKDSPAREKLEEMEKLVKSQKEQLQQKFNDTKRNRAVIQDLQDDLRIAKEEIVVRENRIHSLGEEREKLLLLQHNANISNHNKITDLEDELHTKVRELDDERKKHEGNSMQSLRMHSQLWIHKNRVSKLGKQKEELQRENELLAEELVMIRAKLEETETQMEEQKKISRRVSSILKPGGDLTGKDDIIKELNDYINRLKGRNAELERINESKQEKIRDLEDADRAHCEERDVLKAELETSFSRLDSEDHSHFGSSFSENAELMMLDPKQRHISADFTPLEHEAVEQFNEVVTENENLKLENELLAEDYKRIKKENEREKLYSQNVEAKWENIVIAYKILKEQLEEMAIDTHGGSSSYRDQLPVIQECLEESLYEGTLTDEEAAALRDKLSRYEEELAKERIWVAHLEEENERLRIELSQREEDEDRDSLLDRCSEFEAILRKRQDELENAERMIQDLKGMIDKHEEDHQSSLNDSFEQIDRAQIEISEVKLREEALTFEKTELEIQVRELNEENHKLHDKIVSLKEQILKLTQELESKGEGEKWKQQADEADKKLSKLQEDFDSVSKSWSESEDKVRELEERKGAVETLVAEKEQELERMAKKMEEADVDTVELKQKVEELEEVKQRAAEEIKALGEENQKLTEHSSEMQAQADKLTSELESSIEQLSVEREQRQLQLEEAEGKLREFEEAQQLSAAESAAQIVKHNTELEAQIAELEAEVAKEHTMNEKNRDLMNTMQGEVRDARVERQKAISAQVEVEGRIKIVQQQCEEKVKKEELMNVNNRNLMTQMQTDLRKARAEMAIAQTELKEAKNRIARIEEEREEEIAELDELREKAGDNDLQAAIQSIQAAMDEMDAGNTELLKTLDEKLEQNGEFQRELSEKESTIAALESALSEEMERGDRLESKANKEVEEFGCQESPEITDTTCQSDLQAVICEDTDTQVSVVMVGAEVSTDLTCKAVGEMEVKIEELTQQSSDTLEELCSVRAELDGALKQVKESVAEYESQLASCTKEMETLKETLCQSELSESALKDQITQLETAVAETKTAEASLGLQMKSLEEEKNEIEQRVSSLTLDLKETHNLLEQEKQQTAALRTDVEEKIGTLEKEKQQLETQNKTLKTELEIQQEARTEIDAVIEDREKQFLKIEDTLNLEKMERQTAQETVVTLLNEKERLQTSLAETQQQLDAREQESRSHREADESHKEMIEKLNNELRRRLLEQSYAHVLSSDEEGDGVSTLPRPVRRSLDLGEALEETESSVKALAKANTKLGRQIEKLLAEKDREYLEQSGEMKKMNDILAREVGDKRKLEVELIEREAANETLEDTLVELRRELENSRVAQLKKLSPVSQGTLTRLHDLRYKCFMVIPSDPARDLLHMFVSQYKENLCSNCYARITTLGSRPVTPAARNRSPATSPRKSAGSTSDIVVQTDNSLFCAGTDSAYSSSVSIQTDSHSSTVELLRVKNKQISNELSDSRKSEKELEMALQYQLKTTGELQKKLAKTEQREKQLIEQVQAYMEAEVENERRERHYEDLVEKYRALKEELLVSRDLSERLEQELRRRNSPLRASTPDPKSGGESSNECSMYLSPIHTSNRVLCDRQCDTMSPLIMTWADAYAQTDYLELLSDEGVQGELINQIRNLSQKLCHTLKLDDDTLPALTSAVVKRIEELREEKKVLEVETRSEMNRLHEELLAARDQLQAQEESTVDLEEELERVLDSQEMERQKMQKRFSLFVKLKSEYEKARSDKKLAEDTLNKSLEKLSEEGSLICEEHEGSLRNLQTERDTLQEKLDGLMAAQSEEAERLTLERNQLEKQFFDYKIKSVSEKEQLIESQTRNLGLLERLKRDVESKESQVAAIRQEFEEKIGELQKKNREKSFEVEQLKNTIHQFTNREVDASEKLMQNQKIIDALKRDVLETRERLDNMSDYHVVTAQNGQLREKVSRLEGEKETLCAEAAELTEAIERARIESRSPRLRPLDAYTTPAIAAVAALWHQEREELAGVRETLRATDWELSEMGAHNSSLRQALDETQARLDNTETERSQLKEKLRELNERRIESENRRDSLEDKLNTSKSQLEILLADKEGLERLLETQGEEKEKLMEDLNHSFREKTAKGKKLEECLEELSRAQDQLFSVQDELVRNRAEAERLRESLQVARAELDTLEANIAAGSRHRSEAEEALGERLAETEGQRDDLERELRRERRERERTDQRAADTQEMLQRNVTEVLEKFEEYKQKSGAEKLKELKHGMAALQETLHQIMMTNSELNRTNTSLSEEVEQLRVRNKNLLQERDEYKYQLDNSLIDLTKEEVGNELLSQNQLLQSQVSSLSSQNTRLSKYEHDNGILKSKLRKMRELLREKEDELIALREKAELGEDMEQENDHFKRTITSLKGKLDAARSNNTSLKEQLREYESERILSSTPNRSSSNKVLDLSDESIRATGPVESRSSIENHGLACQSRVSVAASHVSQIETVSMVERCKTLELQVQDLQERYQILQVTHEQEEAKALEMSDALRSSLRMLKGYIERSSCAKGERMSELQEQLDGQRSQLVTMVEQLGIDLTSAGLDRVSLASASTVCDNDQLI